MAVNLFVFLIVQNMSFCIQQFCTHIPSTYNGIKACNASPVISAPFNCLCLYSPEHSFKTHTFTLKGF